MSILFYILWINFVQSRPFGIFCGKVRRLEKSTPAALVALLTNKSYAAILSSHLCNLDVLDVQATKNNLSFSSVSATILYK